MSASPDPVIELVAQALYEDGYDRSECAYFKGEGVCSFGCQDEPACQTGMPPGGWPRQVCRERYADVLTEPDDGWEPSVADRLAAIAVLEALHANGYRVARVATCSCARPDDEHIDGVHHPDDARIVPAIVDQWEPRAGGQS